MVNNPHLSDVQFQVDSGEVIYAHMFVLYARCPQAVEVVSTVDTLSFSDSVKPKLLTPTVSAAAGSAQSAAGPNDKCLWPSSVFFFCLRKPESWQSGGKCSTLCGETLWRQGSFFAFCPWAMDKTSYVLFALEFLYLYKCRLPCLSWCVLPSTWAAKLEYRVEEFWAGLKNCLHRGFVTLTVALEEAALNCVFCKSSE